MLSQKLFRWLPVHTSDKGLIGAPAEIHYLMSTPVPYFYTYFASTLLLESMESPHLLLQITTKSFHCSRLLLTSHLYSITICIIISHPRVYNNMGKYVFLYKSFICLDRTLPELQNVLFPGQKILFPSRIQSAMKIMKIDWDINSSYMRWYILPQIR